MCACANSCPAFIILNWSHFYLPPSAGKSRSLPFLLISTLDRWLVAILAPPPPPTPSLKPVCFHASPTRHFWAYQTYTGLYIQGPGYAYTGPRPYTYRTECLGLRNCWRASRLEAIQSPYSKSVKESLGNIEGTGPTNHCSQVEDVFIQQRIFEVFPRLFTLTIMDPWRQRVRLYY